MPRYKYKKTDFHYAGTMPQNLMNTQARLEKLRQKLGDMGLDGFILPRTDEFQSEFLPACSEHLSWLTGFTGSAGLAIILMDKAVVMSDGRYTIQLADQIDGNLFDVANSTEISAGGWLCEYARDKAKIGYDPWLYTPSQFKKLQEDLKGKDIELVAVDENPVNGIWHDCPDFPQETVVHFPDKLAGRPAQEKLAFVTKKMRKKGAEYLLIAAPDSVCWLLNVRGGDVPFTPLVLSYALVHKSGKMDWFVGKHKASACSFDADIIIHDKDEIIQALSDLKIGKIWLDEKAVSVKLLSVLENRSFDIAREKDPCLLEKAKKTKAEQDSMRHAHIRDGVALVKFLKWLEGHGASGQETELSIEEKLEAFRKEDPAYKGPSFSTIAGFAGNGAIVHYRASEASSKTIEADGLLLVDSGGQYFCDDFAGTTDVTRTIVIGQPTEEMIQRYTLVLKGHIAVSMAKFPYGSTGAQIDTLARSALWQEGLDYAHGTGHGVGCYLGVHEDAASISPKGVIPFEVGMVISNEPGYYKKDAYGIRIENLILVQEDGQCEDTGKVMLGFEVLTFAPYQKELIDFDRLTREEKDWFMDYTKQVFEILGPSLDEHHQIWLKSRSCPGLPLST